MEAAPDGLAVLAEQQSAGRGRLGRSFFSPAGAGLYFSMLLWREEPAEEILRITSLGAVAVCRAIARVTGLETEIKWVNDIYHNGKKLCGILAEGILDPVKGRLNGVVLGIGINCGGVLEDFPEELREIVTTLFLETGEAPNRNVLAAELYQQIREVLAEEQRAQAMEEYRRRSCILGKDIRFVRDNEVQEGVAEDISPEGHLLVRLYTGEHLWLSTSEISVRGK